MWTKAKKIISKPLYWLLLSALCALVALGSQWLKSQTSEQSLRDSFLQNLTQNVHRELKQMDKQNQLFHQQFLANTTTDFHNFLENSNFPIFIFKNGKLLFWSAYRIQPEYAALSGSYTYKTLALKNGKMLVARHVVPQGLEVVEIFTLLPLYTKFSVENNYLKPVWDFEMLEGLEVRTNASVRHYENIFAPHGEFLFSVEFPSDYKFSDATWKQNYTLLLLFAILFATVAVWLWCKQFALRQRAEIGLGILAAWLVLVRGIMLWRDFPFEPANWELFNPRYYASSALTPSLGDLLISIAAVALILIYLLRHGLTSASYRSLCALPKVQRWLAATVFVWLSYWFLYLIFSVLSTLYFDAQWSLDFTTGIVLNSFKVVALSVFVLLSLLYFFTNHLLAHIFLRITRLQPKMAASSIAVAALLCTLSADFAWVLLLLNTLYWLVIYQWRFPKFLTQPSYQTYLYFFAAAVVSAAIGAYSLYNFKQQESQLNKRKMAENLVGSADALAEYLLQDMMLKIESDEFIKRLMISPTASKELIVKKIKKAYIENYFDKYDLQISLFGTDGHNFNAADEFAFLSEWQQHYQQEKYRTEHEQIHFLRHPNPNTLKQYVALVPIAGSAPDAPIIGHIAIDFRQQKGYASNVYPELLLDQKLTPVIQPKGYSYALYDSLQLVLGFGDFNYEKDWNTALLADTNLYNDGIEENAWQHLAMHGDGNIIVLVSSPPYPFKNLFSNFSFLFLTLIFGAIILILCYLAYRRLRGLHLSLSATIQLYLNGAFLLPMVAVSFFTVNIMSKSHKRDLERVLISRTDAVAKTLAPYLEKYNRQQLSREEIEKHLRLVANYTGLDINLFETDGKLLLSSQPSIYEKELLASRINPWAIAEIREKNHNHIMLNELVGSFSYNAVYEGIRSPETGQLVGIVSIPFFDSSNELSRQIASVLDTIINIFTVIFMVFLMLSYYASQRMLVPLRLITQRLHRTTLLRENEPLDWPRQDEIGLLVSEYNKMLHNLAESKIALSRSEKESAWREMAQQVAHEIKNPLTPMKLTLQYLQNALQRGQDNVPAITEKATKTLLVQIENLNDIATSFSAFAKMPSPRTERFNITQTLQETVALYQSNEDTDIQVEISATFYYVLADEKLMSRIFTNLIINAIQAVPQGITPLIVVRLVEENKQVIVSVQDNGSGIPADIQHKIFIPNFSTKYAGSGIGLAVAKRGIEHAGGHIWFETSEEKGTTFFISLPLAPLQ